MAVLLSDYFYAKQNKGVPPYKRVTRSKIYRGYVKPQILPSAIYSYNVIFV
jgi:hypothetical protein